jgi:hypothetical protein
MMNIDPAARSRKRRFTDHNNDDDEDDDDGTNHTPSKRLQSSHGLPIPLAQPYHLNTHLILNSLALTRLRVTANFSLYNPHSSPILINITRSDDTLYRKLWSVPTPYHLQVQSVRLEHPNILPAPSFPPSTPSLPTYKASA